MSQRISKSGHNRQSSRMKRIDNSVNYPLLCSTNHFCLHQKSVCLINRCISPSNSHCDNPIALDLLDKNLPDHQQLDPLKCSTRREQQVPLQHLLEPFCWIDSMHTDVDYTVRKCVYLKCFKSKTRFLFLANTLSNLQKVRCIFANMLSESVLYLNETFAYENRWCDFVEC